MEIKEKELRQLPYSVTKAQLQDMYIKSGLTERVIRNGINAIIADNRKMTSSKSVCVKNIWNKELREFVDTYGLPKGFKL